MSTYSNVRKVGRTWEVCTYVGRFALPMVEDFDTWPAAITYVTTGELS